MKHQILCNEFEVPRFHSFTKNIRVLTVILLCTLSLQSCITLTGKKQTITFTSTPSGVDVYRMYNKNETVIDGVSNYYIGTTPFTYEAKGSGDAFAFVKDGYYSQIIPAKKKGRWLAYILGNLWCMPWGHIADINKIYAYKQDSFSATLIEKPHPEVSQSTSTPPLAMPKSFEANNAKSMIKPASMPLPVRKALTGKQIYQNYNEAVFMIYAGDGFSIGQGSGFVINNSGLAISNYHNFKGMEVVGVKMFGSDNFYKIPDTNIIAYDEAEDYIIFKLPIEILSDIHKQTFTYIPVAKEVAEIGEKVYTIGSPRGLENTLSSGEISAHRDLPYSIQINAPIDHGSSGGALINEYGEAIGITSAGRDDSGANLNFAIDIIRVLKKFK